MNEEQMKYVANLISQDIEKDKEIERLNNIIDELRRMMFCNKMYCEKLFEESKLSREDFKQQHPYTLGSYDNSVNLLERLAELKEGK